METYADWLKEYQRPGGGYEKLVNALLAAQERGAYPPKKGTNGSKDASDD